VTLDIRLLDLADSADVELGRALVVEYVDFTVDEMVRVWGSWKGGDTGVDVEKLVPDLVDFAGRYHDGAFLVASTHGGTAGGVGITRLDDARCEMNRLWLRVQHHRRGYGGALVAACLDRARAMGFTEMVLDVAPYRERAIALYRSFGFVDAPAVHEYPFEMVPLARNLSPAVDRVTGE
jgi:ribosomal protein S18 acetylase RimI-like enzyme